MKKERVRSFRDEAIVIGKRNIFETDKIIDLFTLKSGKISLIARGVRKQGSKLCGSTELFSHGVFTYAKGRNLDVLTGAETRNFAKIWSDLELLGRFSFLGEFLNKVLAEHVANENIYRDTLKTFEEIERDRYSAVEPKFIYKTIINLGFSGSVKNCSSCGLGTKIEELYFDRFSPGVICKECSKKKKEAYKVSGEVVKTLYFIETEEFKKYKRLKLDSDLQGELSSILEHYLQHILHQKFNSSAFLRQIKSLS